VLLSHEQVAAVWASCSTRCACYASKCVNWSGLPRTDSGRLCVRRRLPPRRTRLALAAAASTSAAAVTAWAYHHLVPSPKCTARRRRATGGRAQLHRSCGGHSERHVGCDLVLLHHQHRSRRRSGPW